MSVTGIQIIVQAMIGFGDDISIKTAWQRAAKWQKVAFLATFVFRFMDAWMSSFHADINMLPVGGGVDAQVYWISKIIIFSIDFVGELMAPAVVSMYLNARNSSNNRTG